MAERVWPSRFALWVCRWFGHALFAGYCTRCGYDEPFLVGLIRSRPRSSTRLGDSNPPPTAQEPP